MIESTKNQSETKAKINSYTTIAQHDRAGSERRKKQKQPKHRRNRSKRRTKQTNEEEEEEKEEHGERVCEGDDDGQREGERDRAGECNVHELLVVGSGSGDHRSRSLQRDSSGRAFPSLEP